jgi:hypothetical protein
MRWSVFKIGVNKQHSRDRNDVFGGRAPWIAAFADGERLRTLETEGARTLVQGLPDVLVALQT